MEANNELIRHPVKKLTSPSDSAGSFTLYTIKIPKPPKFDLLIIMQLHLTDDIYIFICLFRFNHVHTTACELCFLARIKITWPIKNIVFPLSSFSIFLETFVVNFTNRLHFNRYIEAYTLQFRAANAD